MIPAKTIYNEMFNSVAREFVGRVELLEGSALADIFTHDGCLQSFTIEKAGDSSKFFGYGVCQKAVVKLVNVSSSVVKKGQGLQIAHGIGDDFIYPYPVFYIDEISADTTSNTVTITAYDAIYKANNHRVNELDLPNSFSLKTFAVVCAGFLGMPISFAKVNSANLNVVYTKSQVNFSGTESIREALDDIAEMLGAIYYLNRNWELTFRQLAKGVDDPDLEITKSKYFSLSVKTAHTLQRLVSVTDVGDNLEANSAYPGETQYLRNNAFLTLRDDAGTLLEHIHVAVQNLTINPFDCKHRGDFRAEIGDKLQLEVAPGNIRISYLLDDTITYHGGLRGHTKWEYAASESEDATNPSTVGDVVRTTYARVNKVENKIELVASNVDSYGEQIGELTLETGRINASVAQTQINTDASIGALNDNMNTLTEKVSAAITSENIHIAVEQSLVNGVDAISTKTGYTFDSDGLTISKSGSEMNTQITEDGMMVYRDDTALLTANHIGVEATNLHATTYLIIGTNSRLENYNETRTGCFWIGN